MRHLLQAAGLLVVAFALVRHPRVVGQERPLLRFQRSEPHMGTAFGLVFYAADEPTANRAFESAFARIAELNQIFSDYEPQSEVSRLSAQSPTPVPVKVSQELFTVLQAAQELSRRTEGAFDVTVGPVTRLWRRARLRKRPPDEEELRAALVAVGYRQLVLHPDERAVELKRPQMRLDFGAIAKGYAVDEALRTLRQFGITRALVNAGGNLVVGEPPPGESAWRVDIAPLEPRGKPTQAVAVANAAVATSGDAYQFFEWNGQRYSHILDPRTGRGLTRRSSVTVIAPTGTLADGLSTAVSVLGHQRGLQLIEDTPATACYIVAVAHEQVQAYASAQFKRWLAP